MFPLFETIRVEEGQLRHISYHQRRVNKSLATLGIEQWIDLHTFISIPSSSESGIFRCRFDYGEGGYSFVLTPYRKKPIQTLRLFPMEDPGYFMKWTDRKKLDLAFEGKENADDTLIVIDGLVSDTTIGNIVFLTDTSWVTPDTPLLAGTTRERLIETDQIRPVRITTSDIRQFRGWQVINAMRNFDPNRFLSIEQIDLGVFR